MKISESTEQTKAQFKQAEQNAADARLRETPEPLDQSNANDAKIDSPRGDTTRTAPDFSDLPCGVVPTSNADNKIDLTILETCDSPPRALTCKNPELDNQDPEYQSITSDLLDQNNDNNAKIDSPRDDATRTAPDSSDLPCGVVSTPNADNKIDHATAPTDAPAQPSGNNDPEHDDPEHKSPSLDLDQDLAPSLFIADPQFELQFIFLDDRSITPGAQGALDLLTQPPVISNDNPIPPESPTTPTCTSHAAQRGANDAHDEHEPGNALPPPAPASFEETENHDPRSPPRRRRRRRPKGLPSSADDKNTISETASLEPGSTRSATPPLGSSDDNEARSNINENSNNSHPDAAAPHTPPSPPPATMPHAESISETIIPNGIPLTSPSSSALSTGKIEVAPALAATDTPRISTDRATNGTAAFASQPLIDKNNDDQNINAYMPRPSAAPPHDRHTALDLPDLATIGTDTPRPPAAPPHDRHSTLDLPDLVTIDADTPCPATVPLLITIDTGALRPSAVPPHDPHTAGDDTNNQPTNTTTRHAAPPPSTGGDPPVCALGATTATALILEHIHAQADVKPPPAPDLVGRTVHVKPAPAPNFTDSAGLSLVPDFVALAVDATPAPALNIADYAIDPTYPRASPDDALWLVMNPIMILNTLRLFLAYTQITIDLSPLGKQPSYTHSPACVLSF